MATIDWTDPCARALALREAYYALISGQSESLIHQSTPEGDQQVRFAKGDMSKLKAELTAAENECAKKNGVEPSDRSRRFAIRAGSRRGC